MLPPEIEREIRALLVVAQKLRPALVEAATARIRSDADADADIGVLLTEPLPQDLYGRSRWAHIAGVQVATGESDCAHGEELIVMLLLLLSAAARDTRDGFTNYWRFLVTNGDCDSTETWLTKVAPDRASIVLKKAERRNPASRRAIRDEARSSDPPSWRGGRADNSPRAQPRSTTA